MNARIVPANESQWSEATRAILGNASPAAENPNGEGPPNILYTIAHHPSLLAPFLEFAACLALRGVLPRRASEILALRAAWNCQSAFEWGHHVEHALANGLAADEICLIPMGPEDPGWCANESLLLRAADELHSDQQLTDSTFAGLRDSWSDAQIVEITFVIGNYTMLSMVAKATGVPIETRLQTLPKRQVRST